MDGNRYYSYSYFSGWVFGVDEPGSLVIYNSPIDFLSCPLVVGFSWFLFEKFYDRPI